MRTIVVLGMHRSGTSALVRAIGLLGARMGPREHLGRNWENRFLRDVNARLLEAGGGDWDAPPRDDDWLTAVDTTALHEVAQVRFGQELADADANVVVWKDPRTCLTLPFWGPIMGAEPVVVLVHRHPAEVARSLESRNQFGPGLSFALWERYNRDALRFAAGMPTTVLRYTDLLDRPRQAMTELAGHLRDCGVELPNDPACTDLEIDPSERHHESAEPGLALPLATDSQRALFDALVSLDGSHPRLSAPADLPPPHPLSAELMQAAGRLRRQRTRRQAGRDRAQPGRSRRREASRST